MPVTWFVLVFLFVNDPVTQSYVAGVRAGVYRSYERCEEAGFKATKRFVIDFVCLPVDQP